jgi:crotonobetainyl-CoA:carnitine CoA-transferase CaiB-like acyl-CoA transferase
MQNFRKGTAERLGIGYKQVQEHQPGIVYSSVSAYGYDGERGADRGWEPVGQAATGMQLRMGGGSPAMQPYALCDYGTGLMGAYSILLGLFHRARTGEGQAVQASLSMTGTLHQTPFMFSYEGRRWDEPAGKEALGSGPLQRLYRASDRWFFLGARPDQLPGLARVEGLAGVDNLAGAELEAELATRFATGPVDTWVARLQAAGLGAHELTDLEDVMEDAWVKSHNLAVVRDHEAVGPVRMVGPSPRLSETPVRVPFAARPPGADSRDVLAEVGISDELATALVRDSVVAVPA